MERGLHDGPALPACSRATVPRCAGPAGRLHWATTETSDVTVGGIDGAMRAGELVAAEVTASEA